MGKITGFCLFGEGVTVAVGLDVSNSHSILSCSLFLLLVCASDASFQLLLYHHGSLFACMIHTNIVMD